MKARELVEAMEDGSDLRERLLKAVNGRRVCFKKYEIPQVMLNWKALSQKAKESELKSGYMQNANFMKRVFQMLKPNGVWCQPGWEEEGTPYRITEVKIFPNGSMNEDWVSDFTEKEKKKDRITKIFNNKGTFAAIHAAEEYCKSKGYSVGIMDGDSPIALVHRPMNYIAKWHNLSHADRESVDGVIESEDFRKGPVKVTFYKEKVKGEYE